MSRRIILGLPEWNLNGVCVFAANLVRGLRAQGEDACLLLTEEHTPLVTHQRHGAPLPAVLPIDRIRLSAHDRWSEAWTAIERYLEERAPCVWLPNHDFRATCISPRLSSRITVVGVLHDDSALHYEHAARQAIAWDAVVAVNPSIHRRAASLMTWLAARLATIPIGVPLPMHVPRRTPAGELRLAYHGVLRQKQKRVLDLVTLLECLDSRGVPVRLTLIGDGDARPEIAARGGRFLADGRLVLRGTLPHEQAVTALGEQDVYVLASDYEGLPNALLEAMAHGCVPVVSDIATLADIVDDGNTGFRCPPGDIEAFATAVAALARDPARRAEMAQKAVASVRERGYDLDSMVQRWRALFARLETRTPSCLRRRGFMGPPPATLGGISILPGTYGGVLRISNQVPLWPEPRTPASVRCRHGSHTAPLRAHRIVLGATSGRISGVDIFSVHLAQALVAQGLRAEILITLPHEKVPDPLPIPGCVPVRELPVAAGDNWRRRWKVLRRILSQDGPCIYIPNYDFEHSAICGTLPGSVKVLGIVHSDDPLHYGHCVRLGATWNAVVAVSKAIAREVKALAPDLADRLHIIPYGIPLPTLREMSPRPAGAPLRLLYAGRLIRYQKRALDLPCILESLAARGVAVELTVAGSGPDEREFLNASVQFLVNGQMRFVGSLANHHVGTLLSRSDVFVLPSAFEGLPVALLEAVAHGVVPVAAHCRSGVDELIKHGENGFLVPVGDTEGFAERITQLAGSPEQRTRMSQAARRTIEAGPFTVERMSESYIALMEKIVSEPFARPITGILPPDHLRGLRSWLPPDLPDPIQTLLRLRRRLQMKVQGLVQQLGK
jgi:glycosyltransferase involved in cell wall biosynthesis